MGGYISSVAVMKRVTNKESYLPVTPQEQRKVVQHRTRVIGGKLSDHEAATGRYPQRVNPQERQVTQPSPNSRTPPQSGHTPAISPESRLPAVRDRSASSESAS